jgi:hypothetical protein
MTPKILIAAGLVLAFVFGTMASGIYSASTRAFNPADEEAVAITGTARTNASVAPVAARTRLVDARAVEPRTVVVTQPAPAPVVEKKKRSWEKEALIIGGSAGAGAAIGAIAGGKKGAGIGAVSGGVAGLIYDIATRNK